MKCPICEKNALFVGVHDDEGNYHGLIGCDYESNPWSGLSYALHHEGWGECPLCTDGAYSTMGGMLFDTAEEAIASLTQPNEPLTLEELQEMDGQPVWVKELNRWALVDILEMMKDHCKIPFALFDDGCIETFNIACRGLHCYRRPPEGEEETP